jgi:hypothetical protein
MPPKCLCVYTPEDQPVPLGKSVERRGKRTRTQRGGEGSKGKIGSSREKNTSESLGFLVSGGPSDLSGGNACPVWTAGQGTKDKEEKC